VDPRPDPVRNSTPTIDRLRDLLRDGHALTQTEIADRLAVTKRQVRRLLADLEESGLPIEERWRGREKEYVLPPSEQKAADVSLDLSEREALALVLAAAAIRSGQEPVPLSEDLDRAFGQITEGLSGQVLTFEPDALSRQLFVQDAGSVEVDGDLFVRLLQAIANRRRLAMDYYTASTDTHRTGRRFEPWALVRLGDTWLCVARDPEKEAMRDFSLARMTNVGPADAASNGGDYTIPEDFDPQVYVSGRFESLAGEDAYTVRLRVDPDCAAYFHSKDYHRTQLIEAEDEEGHLIVSYDVVGLEEITTFVQSWGPDVTVLEPPELRARIAEEARAVVERYGQAASGERRKTKENDD